MDTLVPDTKERINRKITHLRNEITNILHFREKLDINISVFS